MTHSSTRTTILVAMEKLAVGTCLFVFSVVDGELPDIDAKHRIASNLKAQRGAVVRASLLRIPSGIVSLAAWALFTKTALALEETCYHQQDHRIGIRISVCPTLEWPMSSISTGLVGCVPS